MQASQAPALVPLPFAASGAKNAIPTASQIAVTPGAASLADGFPPLTMTPVAAGGVPPSGRDLNGILNLLSANTQWANAGGPATWNSAFCASIGGYPKGAVLESSGGQILWLNQSDNNTTNPDSTDGSATGWVSLAAYGVATVSGLTNANVTLTPAQFGAPVIVFSGTLTGNVQVTFPASGQRWSLINNTVGGYTLTCKTAAGSGIVVPSGSAIQAYGDGTSLLALYAGARTRLTANATFYVSAGGSDTTGTGSVSAPWATVSHALSAIQSSYDLNGYTVTISVGAGTFQNFTATGVFVGAVGPQSVLIQGAGSAATTIAAQTNHCVLSQNGSAITVSGVTVSGAIAGFDGLVAYLGGIINVGADVKFGAFPSTCHHISALGGVVNVSSSYAITGGTGGHWYFVGAGASINVASAITITLSGSPAFTAFAVGYGLGSLNFSPANASFSGAATGQRYSLRSGAVIIVNGAGASYLPGSTAGASDTTYQYQ